MSPAKSWTVRWVFIGNTKSSLLPMYITHLTAKDHNITTPFFHVSTEEFMSFYNKICKFQRPHGKLGWWPKINSFWQKNVWNRMNQIPTMCTTTIFNSQSPKKTWEVGKIDPWNSILGLIQNQKGLLLSMLPPCTQKLCVKRNADNCLRFLTTMGPISLWFFFTILADTTR